MSSELDQGAVLDELLGRQAIWDCMLRYGRGVDRLDEGLIRSAYWPDAHDAHGELAGTIDDFLAGWLPRQGSREVASHVMGNHFVRLHGDRAHAETIFVSSAKQSGSNTLETVAGRYLDRFERRGVEWRIADRLVLLDWQTTADASGMASRLARANTGSRDANDPSYDLFRHVGPLLTDGSASR